MGRSLRERFDQRTRGSILLEASRNASIAWQVSLLHHCLQELGKIGDDKKREMDPLISAEDAEKLMELVEPRLANEIADQRLHRAPKIISLLYHWLRILETQDSASSCSAPLKLEHSIASLMDSLIQLPEGIVRIADGFVSRGWQSTSGSNLSQRTESVREETVSGLIDPALFLGSVRSTLDDPNISDGDRAILTKFLDLWEKRHENHW